MRFPCFRSHFIRLAFLSSLWAFVFTNTGWNMLAMSTTSSAPGSRHSIRAKVMGGRKAISGATISLVEAGTSGKSSSTVLATTTSDRSSRFNISTFTCAYADSQLFLTASGGDAGSGPNPNILLMAALGPCNNLPNYVWISELSTVAAAYAFAQFLDPADPTRMGANGPPGTTQYIGIANAGATLATNLVNIATGTPAATLNGHGNSPSTLNTLADILVSCVDAPSPYRNCDTLFSAVPVPSGGSAPTNTLQAALDIALGPGQNVGTIFGLLAQAPVTLPYRPVLTSAPDSWSLALSFSFPVTAQLYRLAIDQA